MKGQHRWWYHGQNHKSESLQESLRHASRGVVLGTIFEANVRRQVVLGAAAVVLGILLDVRHQQWLALIAVAAFVVAMEFVNSAIEALADAIHPGYNEHIQRSKDLSAAAVLCASGVALIVGLFIFLPPLSTIALWLVNSMW